MRKRRKKEMVEGRNRVEVGRGGWREQEGTGMRREEEERRKGKYEGRGE